MGVEMSLIGERHTQSLSVDTGSTSVCKHTSKPQLASNLFRKANRTAAKSLSGLAFSDLLAQISRRRGDVDIGQQDGQKTQQ